ncbi:protein DpdF [Deinococcus sp. MIMF12]|uniref:Protein DpdF n=1 Tax=Deinococcus rhizophilus TaxID=3049544 RepID=A0ABT7JED3_9DEIO|nr:protein DpdF [Deinococcus rhizophilus]MDL2343417.1 protein DpdF [Deinococcus rhizophilus]
MSGASAAFMRLQSALLQGDWEHEQFQEPTYRRWVRVAASAALRARRGHPSSLDLASMTRQVLRHEALNQGGEISLVVPAPAEGTPWPTPAQWAACSVTAETHGSNHLRLHARPWTPTYAAGTDPTAAATAERRRRHPHRMPADPLFTALSGFGEYSSAGQQQAMRALWYALPGATVLAVLPTGTGKSAVAQVPALQMVGAGRLTVMVMPTVALALDQERALRHFATRSEVELPPLLAYHGGLSVDEKRAFHDRIRAGQQGVLITSPEALVSGLSGALFKVAQTGGLGLLVIDEAHLASQWGNGFRPEFQILAGLRRALLEASPDGQAFKTLLLTATLTRNDLQALRELFGQPGTMEVIAAVKLRPEIEYWSATLPSAEERRSAVIEAALHAPKPLVIYTTRVVDAQHVYETLKAEGLDRVGLVTGKSSPQERRQAVQGWQDATLDIMVATSAFGVGIDQAHVRTVIHACAPESIDRYYQEVGRGGRDGRASLALALVTPSDWIVAEGLKNESAKSISIARGLDRWRRMFQAARPISTHLYAVNNALNPADLLNSTQRSRSWNLHTLNLMARAGLIRLSDAPPPQRAADDSDEAFQKAIEAHQLTQWIELRSDQHLDASAWYAAVEPVRAAQRDEAQRSLDVLRSLLTGQVEASSVLVSAYSVHGPGADPADAIYPQPACGGCAVCRAQGQDAWDGIDPVPNVRTWRAPAAHLTHWVRLGRVTVAVCDDYSAQMQLLTALVDKGVCVVVDPEGTLSREALEALQGRARAPLLLHQSADLLFAPPLPTVCLAPLTSTDLPAAWLSSAPQERVVLAAPHHTTAGGEPLDLYDIHWRFHALN